MKILDLAVEFAKVNSDPNVTGRTVTPGLTGPSGPGI
jgi:hypothetical protein